MFGYTEREYEVLKAYSIQLENDSHQVKHFELRQKKNHINEHSIIPYIAVFVNSDDGKISLDLLFIYDCDQKAQEDWHAATTSQEFEVADYRSVERIEHHYMGYGRNGSVCIY